MKSPAPATAEMRNGKRSATTPERCGVYCGALRISQTTAPIWLKKSLRLSLKNFQRSFPSPSRLSRCSARQRSKSAHPGKLGSPSVFLLRYRPSVPLLSTPLEFLSLSLLRCTSRSCPGRDGTVAFQRRTRARDITGTALLRDNDFFSVWQLHSDFHTSPSI